MKVKQQVKQSVVYNIYLQIYRYRELWQWKWNRRPIPTPHLVKQRAVREYATQFGLDTLVETGTYQGEMVYAMRSRFRRIYSIELDPSFALRAQSIFSSKPNITILPGDSTILLPKILSEISTPCLFWLDAHYSGENTARGEVDTPVMQEVTFILDHPVKAHIILIDDAREFVGKNYYPKLDELKSMITKRRPNWDFEVKDDIIRIHGKRS